MDPGSEPPGFSHGEIQVPHTTHLEDLAREAGFESWHQAQKAAQSRQAAWELPGLPEGPLPVDPDLPGDFDDMTNEDRPREQIEQWWFRPFVRTRADGQLEVRALDGGAWDRSSFYGVASSMEEALELARRKLGEWMESMDEPVASWSKQGVQVVLMPRWPGEAPAVLYRSAHSEGAEEFMKEWNSAPTERRRERARSARSGGWTIG